MTEIRNYYFINKFAVCLRAATSCGKEKKNFQFMVANLYTIPNFNAN